MSCNQNRDQGRDCTCGQPRKIRISISPMLALLLVAWLGAWVLRSCA